MNNIPASADASIDRLKEITTWVLSVQDLDQLLELIIETATRMMDAKASSLLPPVKKEPMSNSSKSISARALPVMSPKPGSRS